MILFEITQNEDDPAYRELEIANGNRQYDFLASMVNAAIATNRPFLSETLLEAFNFQAIACLHVSAGAYRPCDVTVGSYNPPRHFRVFALMEDFVNRVNRAWETSDPVVLASFVLWNINFIHPFINGNGRTARAACYFVLCAHIGGLLKGTVILPELLRRNREEYVVALQAADESYKTGKLDFKRIARPYYAFTGRAVGKRRRTH